MLGGQLIQKAVWLTERSRDPESRHVWSLTPDWNQLACTLNESLSYSEPSVFFLREQIFGWVEIDAEEMPGGSGEGNQEDNFGTVGRRALLLPGTLITPENRLWMGT